MLSVCGEAATSLAKPFHLCEAQLHLRLVATSFAEGNIVLCPQADTEEHFIKADVRGDIDYGNDLLNIYALDKTQILDIAEDKYFGVGINCGHLKMACNDFDQGRSFYMTDMKYNADNTRLLYRALLWTAHKEEYTRKAFSTNPEIECHYYPNSNKYAIVNNTDTKQSTVFYDIEGKTQEIHLNPLQILWI